MTTIEKLKEELVCRWLSRSYDIGSHKRVYHLHIRKTGGTSLNYMFMSLVRSEPWASAYARLTQLPHHRIVRDKMVFVGWNGELINQGRYFYAFSHMPLHQLRLKPGTFTVTCFRDPCRRLVSHYNMLMELTVNKVPHVCLQTEGAWLGGSFEDFLDRIPREHLQNQIYMFSKTFSVEEALDRIARLSHVMFTEEFAAGVGELNRKTALKLAPVHTRKTGYKAEISEKSLERLRDMLAPEYELLARVRKAASARSNPPMRIAESPTGRLTPPLGGG
jgi:hypothetical protein